MKQKFDIGQLNKGKHLSPETKLLISQKLKGRKVWNKGTKGIMKAWNKGKKWSQDIKDKISKSRKDIPAWNKGLFWSEEVKAKISQSRKSQPAWNKGKKWSDEVKMKISKSKKASNLQKLENTEIKNG